MTNKASEREIADDGGREDTWEDTWKAFRDAVNMTPVEIETWLETDESREAGWTEDGERESIGHKSGRRIVDIRHTKKADLTEEDFAHMKKVVGYVHRHLAQRPKGDVRDTKWRHSLMNWGQGPLKD